MAEHKHGDMNIETQEKTFDGFMKWTVRMVIFIIAVLIYLAIFWS